MAVEDKYINQEAVSANAGGSGSLRTSIVSFEVAAADDDGSVYRILQLAGNARLIDIKINCDVITSSTDWDVGGYNVDGGAVVDKDALADGLDLSGGKAVGSEANGLTAVAIENRGKKFYELLGKTDANKAAFYDLALTANTVGSLDGTVTVTVTWMV